MRTISNLSAVALALGLGQIAHADPADFTGFGLALGYGAAQLDGHPSSSAPGPDPADAQTVQTAAVTLGYTMLAGDWVVGGAADATMVFDVDDIRFDDKNAFGADETAMFTLRGVAGREVTPGMLVYGTAGVSSWALENLEDGGTVSVQGYMVGVGGEYQIRPGQFLTSEIRYHQFGESETVSEVISVDPPATFDQTVEPELIELRVGYTFRF